MSPEKVVASFCVTFLAPEMLHVYRQITGLQQFRPHVVTQKWINRERFPFPDDQVSLAPKSRARFFRRLWHKQLLGGPIMVSGGQRAAILREIEACDASVLHIYFGHIGVYLLPVLRDCPIPKIVSFHGADAGVDMDKAKHRAAMSEVFQLADLILARSESLVSKLLELGCPQEKIRISRTGIPMDDWPFIERATPPDGAWRLFQACRLMDKKGLDVAIRAFARIREKFPNATFEIAGEGPLLEPLQALARELGISEAVSFLGFLNQNELRAAMNRAHVFVHPSRTSTDGNREGVPNSMLEAMATGLPVVATRHGGIPEAVEEGVSGLLVDEDDEDGLTQQLLAVLEDGELRLQLGKAARTGVAAKFSQQAQIENLESCYAELLPR
ncbi:MAG: colanic acid/amylovoran biosynthesis glycosyltransferase [Verrucomicrobiales bacterium]